MVIRQRILFLLPAVAILFFAGCGGSTSNVQNPPPPPPNPVVIQFQTQPAGSINVGSSESIIATVTNDPANAGVDWALVCPTGVLAGNCGTLSAPPSTNSSCTADTASHTASGCPIAYTAPASLAANTANCVLPDGTLLPPTDCLPVQIVAYATTDHNQNQVASIQVDSFNGQLGAGNYVFHADGQTGGFPYQIAGVITLDGAGNITAGEQTANFSGVSLLDTISQIGSSYFIGSDGRGLITLNTNDLNIGGNGIETFALVYLSGSQALISQIDTGSAATGASATGTIDLQNSAAASAAPSGSYAFVMHGTDILDNSVPLAFGGVFDIVSGQTAITGVADELIAGAQKLTDGALAAGSEISSGPDAFGLVTITLQGIPGASHPKPVTVILNGYIVDATHLRLIESDTAASSGVAPFATTGGLAVAQASGLYGNFADSSFSGTYVYGVTGVDLSPLNGSYTPTTLTSAGLFSADANGGLNAGFTDIFLQLNCVQAICKNSGDSISGAQISSTFTGSYAVDSTGRTTVDNFTYISSPPNPSNSPTLYFYLTGQASPEEAALILAAGDIGSNPKLHYPSIGSGVAYAQAATNVNLGDCAAEPACYYGSSFTQVSFAGENDGTAQSTANSTATPEVSGIGDSTAAPPPPNDATASDHAFSGSFGSPQANGYFTGTLANYNSFGTGNDGIVFSVGNNNNGTDAFNLIDVDYYPIDQTHGFFVETDLLTGVTGEQSAPASGQVSFGYYAQRTPVCEGCQARQRAEKKQGKKK